jgi:hypothetical protein
MRQSFSWLDNIPFCDWAITDLPAPYQGLYSINILTYGNSFVLFCYFLLPQAIP